MKHDGPLTGASQGVSYLGFPLSWQSCVSSCWWLRWLQSSTGNCWRLRADRLGLPPGLCCCQSGRLLLTCSHQYTSGLTGRKEGTWVTETSKGEDRRGVREGRLGPTLSVAGWERYFFKVHDGDPCLSGGSSRQVLVVNLLPYGEKDLERK